MAEDGARAPVEDDLRDEDLSYNPAVEPESAEAWLNLLLESEKAFEDWNDHCDKIDKMYASLERLANMGRDRQFQMFWANCEVIKPSIYAKPPVPVVVPKFKDRRPVPQAASEMAERLAIVAFDLAHIDGLMKSLRDDVALIGRGVPWCRYESGKGRKGSAGGYGHEKVCIDFKNRRDFLHSISRTWEEVTWVAAASYLTRSEARDRFKEYSGDAYQEAEYRVDKDSKEVGGADARERAKFWEIWSKTHQRVIWVAHGVEVILDEDDQILDLRNFFPCPKPAYGVVQRGSLVPVPDILQYKDQLDELNTLTTRIHALAESLEVKGFYPAGGDNLAEAIQQALAMKTPGRVLVPVSNWAAFGGSKEVIIWLPIDQIAQTVTALVALRKEIIQDIYQIMGLSDIMRGATDPQETLGAQQLKTQYGSTRIRDKQQELVRIARDLVEIVIEIVTEKFSSKTIIAMSQTQLPPRAQVQQQIQQLQQQMQQMVQQAQQAMQQNPQLLQQNPQLGQQFQKQMQQMQAQLATLQEKPTIESVLAFLKDNRARSFVLDIETDSTILADENAEKQRRTEFVQVLSNLLPQIAQMITSEPAPADFCGELLKFSVAPFRAGRSLDGAIDDLIEKMKARGADQRENPEVQKVKLQQQTEEKKIEQQKARDDAELQIKRDELAQKDRHKQMELDNDKAIEIARMQQDRGDQQAKVVIANEKRMQNREAHQAHMVEKQQDMALGRIEAENKMREVQMRSSERMRAAADRRAQQQFRSVNPVTQ